MHAKITADPKIAAKDAPQASRVFECAVRTRRQVLTL
jgi:hypothetical protein